MASNRCTRNNPRGRSTIARASKRELLATTSGVRLHTQETLVDQFGPAASNFIQATDRQLQLIQKGKFEEARRLDFEEVSQQFDVLQHQLHQASDAEARVAEAAATKSRIELVIAFVLVAASTALLFLRFQCQEQLMCRLRGFFSKPVPSNAVKTIVDLNKRRAKHAEALEVQPDLSV
jgi:hypothetical protein